MDIVAKEMGGKGYTWLSVAILEDDYKAHSFFFFPWRFATTFHVEAAWLQREDRINARRQCQEQHQMLRITSELEPEQQSAEPLAAESSLFVSTHKRKKLAFGRSALPHFQNSKHGV